MSTSTPELPPLSGLALWLREQADIRGETSHAAIRIREWASEVDAIIADRARVSSDAQSEHLVKIVMNERNSCEEKYEDYMRLWRGNWMANDCVTARKTWRAAVDKFEWLIRALLAGSAEPRELDGEVEEVIACLGDDAAALREVNPECEIAANMERAAVLLGDANSDYFRLLREKQAGLLAGSGGSDSPESEPHWAIVPATLNRHVSPGIPLGHELERLRQYDEARSSSGGSDSHWFQSSAELAAIYGEMCAINETLDKHKTPEQFARLATLRAECVASHYRRIALSASTAAPAPSPGGVEALTDEQIDKIIAVVRRFFGGMSSHSDKALWLDVNLRCREALRALASPAAAWQLCWLVELFHFDGTSNRYYLGYSDEDGYVAETKDPGLACRYPSKETASMAARRLKRNTSARWEAVEHEFALSASTATALASPAGSSAPQAPAPMPEPVAIYHGRCTIDCGEHGHLDMELLKMIPAGTKLYAGAVPAAPSSASEAATETYWLIERGPNQGHWRQEWWTIDLGAGVYGDWTLHVHQASKFATKDAADAAAKKHQVKNYVATRLGQSVGAVGAVPEPSKAAQDVLAERQRQISAEGWTLEHDDKAWNGQFSRAASAYARHAGYSLQTGRRMVAQPQEWPWAPRWWKPGEPRRNLVKAGALILAEIERLDRATPSTPEGQKS